MKYVEPAIRTSYDKQSTAPTAHNDMHTVPSLCVRVSSRPGFSTCIDIKSAPCTEVHVNKCIHIWIYGIYTIDVYTSVHEI